MHVASLPRPFSRHAPKLMLCSAGLPCMPAKSALNRALYQPKWRVVSMACTLTRSACISLVATALAKLRGLFQIDYSSTSAGTNVAMDACH